MISVLGCPVAPLSLKLFTCIGTPEVSLRGKVARDKSVADRLEQGLFIIDKTRFILYSLS
jgi:hypothetical protein